MCHHLGLVFLFAAVHASFSGFVSEMGYNAPSCQSFRVSETRKFCAADRVYWFNHVGSQIWVNFRNHIENCRVYRFTELGLLRCDYGEIWNLCVLVAGIRWFRCVGDFDSYLFVNYCWNWKGFYQSRGFCELFHWSHCTGCILSGQVINKGCDCFCFHWWYCFTVVNENSLRFSTRSFRCTFTCIVKCGKWMRPRVVSMTTLLCLLNCNPRTGPARFFIIRKGSAKVWYPISTISVAVANVFSSGPFVTCIWKKGGSSIFRILDGACCLIMSTSFWANALT